MSPGFGFFFKTTASKDSLFGYLKNPKQRTAGKMSVVINNLAALYTSVAAILLFF